MKDGSIRELARRVGISDMAIIKARDAGRIPADLFGKRESGRAYVLDLDHAEQVVRGALDVNGTRGRKPGSKPKAATSTSKPAAQAVPVEEGIDPVTGVPPRQVSDARRAHWEAVKAQAQAEETTGALLQREAVVRSAFAVAREVRDSLLLIEDRLADQLAAITDPAEVRVRLREEFRTALEKLSGELVAGGDDAVS